MKKVLIVNIAIAMVCAAQLVANTITPTGGPNGYGPWQTGRGGEFTLAPDAQLASALGPYSSLTRDWVQQGTFQSFCIEVDEHISGNTTYNVNFSDHSVFGNVTLNKGTAWLYEQFARGILTGYDYGSTIPARHASAAALQNEIWLLMGQGGSGDAYFGSLVAAAATAGGWNVNDANNGQFQVEVLNVWSGAVGTGKAQDMLVMVPDAGATVTLLSMGFGCVTFLARKRRDEAKAAQQIS